MSLAEIVDAFRVVPRVLVVAYSWLIWVVVSWFMLLPDPTTQHTILVSTIVGGSAAVFGLYTNSGASWESKTAKKDNYIEPILTEGVNQTSKTPTHIRKRPVNNKPLDINLETPPDGWGD